MDQAAPHYSVGYGLDLGSNFGGTVVNDYFPSYPENDYDIPGQYIHQEAYPQSYQFHHHHNNNNNRQCAQLPNSPPDYPPGQHYDTVPSSHRHFDAGCQGSPSSSLLSSPPSSLNSPPSVYALSTSAGSGSSGGSVTIPFKSAYLPATAINHPSFQNGGPGIKRLRGTSGSSVSCSSPLDCKVEDDADCLFSTSAGSSTDGQFYQEPQLPDTSEAGHRNIDFKPIFREQWCATLDASGNAVLITDFKVQADKGFNFSQTEDVFICQKKNHFQVTIQLGINGVPKFIQKTLPGGIIEYQEILGFYLDLFGVKAEAIQQTVKIDQSQSDRSRKEFKAYHIPALNLQQQLTIGRLHFYETTQNNMRKKGKPNPDQRFFRLVVGMYAEARDGRTGETARHMLYASASENIVVRASNPGQFENDTTPVPSWQRAQNEDDGIFHQGNIGINNDRPEEALDVRGNMRLTGRMIQPSDARAKDILGDADPSKQLENIKKLRIVRYKYKDRVVAALNLTEASRYDTGILAQDVMDTIPEAVEIVGDLELEDGDTLEDFLMVNKDRLYMEGLGAVQALSVLADDYGNRLTDLERKYLRRFAQMKSRDSFRSNISAATAQTIYSSIRTGMSVSARQSIYGLSPPKVMPERSYRVEKPGGFSPKAVLGKNYIQWLTLALVVLISVCLISILGVYITSKLNGPAVETISVSPLTAQQSTPTVAPSTTVPWWHRFTGRFTLPARWNITTATSTQTTPVFGYPTPEPVSPTFVSSDDSDMEALLDALFTTGTCGWIKPITSDVRCVMNSTYAVMTCPAVPVFSECCGNVRAPERPTKEAVPEAVHFPEYQQADKPDLPQNLKISFDLDGKDKHTRNEPSRRSQARTVKPLSGRTMYTGRKDTEFVSENLVPQELNDGQAVLYQSDIAPAPSALRHTDVPWAQTVALSCNRTADVSNETGFKWRYLAAIHLIEPGLSLDSSYCYQRDQACGTDNTYVIPLPVSRYFIPANITVLFRRDPGTVLKLCQYNVVDYGCFKNSGRGIAKCWQRSRDLEDSIKFPVIGYAHSQLTVRVAPDYVAAVMDICAMESPEISTYKLMVGRSCTK